MRFQKIEPPEVNEPAKTERLVSRMKFTEAFKSLPCHQNSTKLVTSVGLHLFVTRLDPTIDEKVLSNYFGRFGEVINVFVRKTSFAFISYSGLFGESPLKIQQHVINGRNVDVKEIKDYGQGDGEPTDTLFVTGSLELIQIDDIQRHFFKFGNIISIHRPKGKEDGEHPRCCFIVFEETSSVDRALDENHIINSQFVYVKRVRKVTPHCEEVGWNTQRRKERKDSKNIGRLHNTLTLHLAAESPTAMKLIKEEYLVTFFSRFGTVISVRKPIDSRTKEPLYYAFVEFATCNAVEKAMGKFASNDSKAFD